MPNLHDVVTIEKPSAFKLDAETRAQISALSQGVKQNFDFRKMLFGGSRVDAEDEAIITKVNAKIEEIRKNVFAKHMRLPTELVKIERYFLHGGNSRRGWGSPEYGVDSSKASDALTQLSQTPILQLSDLRAIADKLCMIIMPFDFIDDRAHNSENYAIREQISTFRKAVTQQGLKVYVICPPRYYNIEKHVASNSAYTEIYAGSQQMIFSAVGMNIPMFRTIITDLADMRDRMNTLGNQVKAVEKSMATMQRQIVNLERDMERTRREALEAKIEATAARAEAQATRRAMEISFIAEDPMLLAFPSDKDVNDDTTAFVGPAWGPDFKDILCELNGLPVVKGQRTKLQTTMQMLYR